MKAKNTIISLFSFLSLRLRKKAFFRVLLFFTFVTLSLYGIHRWDDYEEARFAKAQKHYIIPDTFPSETNLDGWHTYTNKEFGFEVKLPTGCEFTERRYKLYKDVSFNEDSGCYGIGDSKKYIDVKGGGVGISVYPNTELFNDGNFNCDGDVVKVESNNPMSEARLCYQNLTNGVISYSYAFIKNNKGYVFGIGHQDKTYDIRIEKAILNSFRFINEQ